MAVVHSWMGEKLLIGPLQNNPHLPVIRGNPKAAPSTLRFTWHVTSVFGLGFAGVLFYYANNPQLVLTAALPLKVLAVTFLVSGFVAIIGSKGRHLSWLVFWVMAVLIWLGLGG